MWWCLCKRIQLGCKEERVTVTFPEQIRKERLHSLELNLLLFPIQALNWRPGAECQGEWAKSFSGVLRNRSCNKMNHVTPVSRSADNLIIFLALVISIQSPLKCNIQAVKWAFEEAVSLENYIWWMGTMSQTEQWFSLDQHISITYKLLEM